MWHHEAGRGYFLPRRSVLDAHVSAEGEVTSKHLAWVFCVSTMYPLALSYSHWHQQSVVGVTTAQLPFISSQAWHKPLKCIRVIGVRAVCCAHPPPPPVPRFPASTCFLRWLLPPHQETGEMLIFKLQLAFEANDCNYRLQGQPAFSWGPFE